VREALRHVSPSSDLARAGQAFGTFNPRSCTESTYVKPFEATPTLNRCCARHAEDHAELSATPELFKTFVEDVGLLGRTQPNYSAHDLARIGVPVVIGQSENDEFILREHAEYLARSMPNAEFALLNGVTLQRPRGFNATVLEFVAKVLPREAGEVHA
jgi:pimeloyl-ACP methyl ester carboxylesterase